MTVNIAPALLGADPLDLLTAVERVQGSTAAYLHLDVMDGHYTNDINFGLRTIRAIREETPLVLDVHLQTLQPERYIDQLIEIGVHRVSMHVDASTGIEDALKALQQAGVRKGLVLNPELPLTDLERYLDRLDYVILMTSRPGTSTFEPKVIAKIKELRRLLDHRLLDTVEIVADGGITDLTAPEVIDAGIDTLVAASAVFNSPDTDVVDAITRLAGEHLHHPRGDDDR
ncbi:ribulose-phosphate 3-epimerase [Nocardia suismassiliense]|uniref:Ribulose-phosphate 3-epimerase n=1 Tax=Nocardia suismassiliense TaxID=2077092 RepID=A0ABW6QU22_9NOCA